MTQRKKKSLEGAAEQLLEAAERHRVDAEGLLKTLQRLAYEAKFPGFIRLCAAAQRDELDIIIIATPTALGDTRDEMIESLNRISDTGKPLQIVPRSQRTYR